MSMTRLPLSAYLHVLRRNSKQNRSSIGGVHRSRLKKGSCHIGDIKQRMSPARLRGPSVVFILLCSSSQTKVYCSLSHNLPLPNRALCTVHKPDIHACRHSFATEAASCAA